MPQLILTQFLSRYTELIATGQIADALDVIDAVTTRYPEHELRFLRPSCLKSLERYQDARAEALSLLQTSPPLHHKINLWDVLAHCCGLLKMHNDAVYYGSLSLQAKANLTETTTKNILPTQEILTSSGRNSGQWVIAFSLYGNNPRYGETAVLNVLEAKKWLPQWVCRFYCDDSVSSHLLKRLETAGAQIHRVNASIQNNIPGTFWRMLVVDDPTVSRFLQRDADSLISQRESLAVEDWLHSDKCFHAMRDWWSHSELLLAGMWGGCTSGLLGMREKISAYLWKNSQKKATRTADQHFLRTEVWPLVSQSLLTHDPYFRFHQGIDFPSHEPLWHGVVDQFTVGMNFAGTTLEVASEQPDGSIVEWMIHDGTHEICRYNSTVENGRWSAMLPNSYSKYLTDKVWRVCPPNQPHNPWPLLRPWFYSATTSMILKRH